MTAPLTSSVLPSNLWTSSGLATSLLGSMLGLENYHQSLFNALCLVWIQRSFLRMNVLTENWEDFFYSVFLQIWFGLYTILSLRYISTLSPNLSILWKGLYIEVSKRRNNNSDLCLLSVFLSKNKWNSIKILDLWNSLCIPSIPYRPNSLTIFVSKIV